MEGTPLRFIVAVIVLVSISLLVFDVSNVNNNFRSGSIDREISSSNLDLSVTRRLDDGANDYQGAVDLLKKLCSLIYNRYEFDTKEGFQMFHASSNTDAMSWELMKFKFASKILTKDANYLMVFSGSSVTAGHDSYYNQSYPFVVQKRMGEIFAKLGIDLQIHNIAQGANNCLPYVFCYETMGGFSPDFLNWEQSYNCGHSDDIYEATTRVIAESIHKGGMMYFSASGAWSPNKCPPAEEKVPYCSEEWTPSTAGLKEWDASPVNLEDMKTKLLKYGAHQSSYNRFARAYRNDYKSVAFGGFNVWEVNDACNFHNPKNNKDEHCNGIDASGECKMKFMSLEASVYGSDNGKGANHHPTRAFHMWRGEAISWLFALNLLETIQMIETDLKSKSTDELLKEYDAKLSSLSPALPSPKKCAGSLHCQFAHAQCYTDYRPHYSRNNTLSEIIVGSTKWEYNNATYSEWSLHYGYLDSKPKFSAQGSIMGEIHVLVHVGPAKLLWLCGEKKESLMHAKVFLDENVKDDGTLKDSYTPSSSRKELTKFTTRSNECKELDDLPEGTHVISISTHESNPDHTTALTHVVQWP